MKKRIFLDTNVMFDFLSERNPFYKDAARILTYSESNGLEIYVSPLSYANVCYFLTKFKDNKLAYNKLKMFKSISKVSVMSEVTVDKALASDFKDFEDALQHFSALESKCEIIITRDKKDFKTSLIPVLSPEDFVKTLS